MTDRYSRRAIARALLATTALVASPALADLPAPRFVNIDKNGVDLTTGKVQFAFEEGGIGRGEGAVRIQRIFAQDAKWIDNYSGGLFDATIGGVTKTYVEIAGISDVFTKSGSTYTSDNAAGSTLAQDPSTGFWNYVAADGTKITFLDTGYFNYDFSCPGADAQTCRLPQTITKPNGLKINFTWQTGALCYNIPGEPCSTEKDYNRLTGISTSAGYSATITYVSSSIGTWPSPNPDWFKRSTITFTNSVSAPSPAPSISYTYPSSGVTTVTDPGGRQWQLTTDTSGRITGIRRPGSSSDNVTYAYGADGTISSATKDGVTTNYARSVSGSTATETTTDPLSHQTVTTSDLTKGRPTSFKDELNHSTSYTYDGNSRLTQVTQPEGNAVQYAYDARGNVTTTTNVAKSGSGLANIVTSASFDPTCTNIVKCNKPNSTTDAKSNVTDYTYDATHGGITSVTQPAGSNGIRPQVRSSYSQVTSASGDQVYELTGTSACQTSSSCVGGSDEAKATIAYNSNLLPTSVTSSNGTGSLSATTVTSYDARGRKNTVDGPLSGTADTTKYRWSNADQLVGVTDPDPDGTGPLKMRATRTTYRPDGQVNKQEVGTVNSQSDADWTAFAPSQTVDIAFDSSSRPVTRKLSAGGTDYALTQTGYDGLGRTDCTAVRMNVAVYGSLPAACTLSTPGSFGADRVSQTVYDAASEPTQYKVAVGTGDAANDRLLTYTPNGLVASLDDGEFNLTTYGYDGFDRQVQVIYPSSTKGSGTNNPSDYEQLYYDANNNVTARRNRAGTTLNFTYDNLNRRLTKVVPDVSGLDPYYTTGDVYYGYDNLGRMTFARFNSTSGEGITNSYDALGRVVTSTTNLGGVNRSFAATYDAIGDRLSLTGDGYNAGFTYDALGRMAFYMEGQTTATVNIGYDDLGRRSFMNRLASSTTYQYDGGSRLSVLTQNFNGLSSAQNFNYNPAAQIVSQTRSGDTFADTANANANTTYTSNGLNRYTNVGGSTAAYDGNGNLTSDPLSGKSYGYDSENRLIWDAQTSTALFYDPLGRLWSKATGSVTTRFIYDGNGELIREYDGNGAILNSYVHGPKADEVLVNYQDSPTAVRRFPHADERGSTIALADSNGNVLSINKYDEFGVPQGSVVGRFGYTGQIWLPEVGLQYSKARMYSPQLGRFMQTDPVGYSDGANWYNYANSDPVNGTDPTGNNVVEGDEDPLDGVPNSVEHSHDNLSLFLPTRDSGGRLEAAHFEAARAQAQWNDLLQSVQPALQACANNACFTPASAANPPLSIAISFSIQPQNSRDVWRPYNQLPSSARTVLSSRQLLPDGEVTVNLPSNYSMGLAVGDGLIFRPSGSYGNDNIIRMMGPNQGTPYPYIVFHNSTGQPISPFSGQTLDQNDWHYRWSH